ncbi:MAG: tRNA pseudouridine(38-40) synthase TruA [Halioglobus sp.]|nr:tRNA pseudouridine(38-40) synthase TruA [Halioglobus sp.]
MHYFRVTIAYKGTHYFGWQAQTVDTSQEEKPTVEGTLLNCLKKIANYQSCTISAASRTDGGVHAQGQIAKISLPLGISPARLLLGLNSLLPADIRIIDCTPATKDYQPNKASIRKEYHYYFSISPIDNVATTDIALHLPLGSNEQGALELLRSACALFTGRHDFYNFCANGSGADTTVRQIFYCDIHKADFLPLANNIYYLKVIGDGFLKHMIRYLMGALQALLKGRITINDITRYLQQHQQEKLSPKAKSKGLHLIRIEET